MDRSLRQHVRTRPAHPLALAAAQARRPHAGHRLVVAASGIAAVITHAGGWLFDRAMAGWEVIVLVDEADHQRALQILGARAVDLESALAAPTRIPLPQALAVDPRLYRRDARVRDGVAEAVEYGLIDEVTMWDEGFPYELDQHMTAVEHRLSAAARTFKQTALSAAAGTRSGPAARFEIYRSRGALSRPPSVRDLAPVVG